MRNTNLVLKENSEYALLDSGNGRKFERFGEYKIIRPEKQALWEPSTEWANYDAEFIKTSDKHGDWNIKNKAMPREWVYSYDALKLKIKLTPFGHVGVFPELGPQWDFIAKCCHSEKPFKVLSLFSYTGGATLAAAACGAQVTHVDASKPAITWAVENQKLSNLENKPIRWIIDDALKFIKREARRGNRYDGIIMDPPKFGRGPKGEMWQFEKDITELLHEAEKILSDDPKFFLIMAYAVPISSITLANMLQDIFKNRGEIEYGEMTIEEIKKRLLPTSLYARWAK